MLTALRVWTLSAFTSPPSANARVRLALFRNRSRADSVVSLSASLLDIFSASK